MPTSSEVVKPASVDELSSVMKSAAGQNHVVGVRGAGTKAGWPGPGQSADVVIDSTGLDRIVEHAAGDLVVTVQVGVRLVELQRQLGGSKQWLALDPPETDATVGGIVAAAASGPRRLLYGTPRDLLIGITVVLADGTIAHSGGKVVKNVAGYDLGKLFTGSFGTLGVIAQCTFRLHPLPPARRVVSTVLDGLPGQAVRTIKNAGVVPSAIEWDGTKLTTVIESTEASAHVQADEVVTAVGGSIGDELPDGFGQRPWSSSKVGLKVTHRLGGVDEVLSLVARHLPAPAVAAHAGSGVVWVGYDGDGGEIATFRDAVAPYDGQVVVVHAPDEIKHSVDTWGPTRGVDVMRRIKDRFDPENRMSPGTFVGGI